MRAERKAVSILSEITSAQTDAEQPQGCEPLEELPGCKSSVNGFNTCEAVEVWMKASAKTKSVIRLVWLYQKGVFLAGREVSNHFQGTIFGGVVMSDEKVENFNWVFTVSECSWKHSRKLY